VDHCEGKGEVQGVKRIKVYNIYIYEGNIMKPTRYCLKDVKRKEMVKEI
jgi:hypothetical protein